MNNHIITTIEKQFVSYKSIADKAIAQIDDSALNKDFDGKGNSVGVLIKHISGNMKSRFSDFIITDGEKSWRNKPQEFLNEDFTKASLLPIWEDAWQTLFNSVRLLDDSDLLKTTMLKGKEITVANAVLRQLTHYSYHIGQIVYAAKVLKNEGWRNVT